jgi:hypothetical protein
LQIREARIRYFPAKGPFPSGHELPVWSRITGHDLPVTNYPELKPDLKVCL